MMNWTAVIVVLVAVVSALVGWVTAIWWAFGKTRSYLWHVHATLRRHCPEDYQDSPAYCDN
jgi:hypothetical protein